MQRSTKSRKEKLFYTLLCLYLFYYSYRYVLKYNFTGTSPTYSDTPLVFQLTKYIFLILITAGMYLFTRNGIRFRRGNKYVAVALIFLTVQFLVLGVLSRNFDAISIALLFIPCLFFLSGRKAPDLESVERIFTVFWWYSAIYELIQLFLYIRMGRLPALAYATGQITDVRFGGAWDDPNGYALLMIFYIFFFLFKYKKMKQVLYVGASVVMLLLTWSGTGYIALVITAVILLLIKANDKKLIKKYLYYGLMVVIALVAALALYHVSIFDHVGYYLLQKQLSASMHMDGWDTSRLGILTFLGIMPDYIGSEVGFIRLLSIGGIPAVLALLMIGNFACSRFRLLARINGPYRPLMYGALAYSVAFILFEANLPHIVNFSCMGIFTYILCIACCVTPEVLNAPNINLVRSKS